MIDLRSVRLENIIPEFSSECTNVGQVRVRVNVRVTVRESGLVPRLYRSDPQSKERGSIFISAVLDVGPSTLK